MTERLTISQATHKLREEFGVNVTTRTVRAWCESGALRAKKITSRLWLVEADGLAEPLADGYGLAKPPE